MPSISTIKPQFVNIVYINSESSHEFEYIRFETMRGLFFSSCQAAKDDINPQHHIPLAFTLCYPTKFHDDNIKDHNANSKEL